MEIFNTILFSLGDYDVKLGSLIITIITIAISVIVYKIYSKPLIEDYLDHPDADETKKKSIPRIFRITLVLIVAIFVVQILGLNYIIYSSENYDLKISHILLSLIILQVVRILDFIISNILIHKYYKNRDVTKTDSISAIKSEGETSGTSLVQYIFYILALIILLRIFNIDFTIFERHIDGQIVRFKISNIIAAILIIFIARLFIWLSTQLIMYNVYRRKEVDLGAQYAINQLVKYVIYLFAIILALDSLGINMTLLLGGAAALLVGIGLGLQQTFNDFISGIVLLFERSVSVGDVVEIDNEIAIVKKIGMRASILESRGNISFIVPNSKLVNEKVTNWTHFSKKVRFNLPISVAYGTDTSLVKKILLEIAQENPYIIKYPAPFVRFEQFASSDLSFNLYFFSRNYIIIEDIKSDMRFEIDDAFRKHDIKIPFPQREIWINKQE